MPGRRYNDPVDHHKRDTPVHWGEGTKLGPRKGNTGNGFKKFMEWFQKQGGDRTGAKPIPLSYGTKKRQHIRNI